MPRKSSSRKPPSLGYLIRRSPVLDAAARRHWLAVLPHLTADDQARLREILEAAMPQAQPDGIADPPSADTPRAKCQRSGGDGTDGGET